jgi:hypothetical protein
MYMANDTTDPRKAALRKVIEAEKSLTAAIVLLDDAPGEGFTQTALLRVVESLIGPKLQLDRHVER